MHTPGVAKAAVVGYPHPIKGTAIYAFVVPGEEAPKDDDVLRADVVRTVREVIGPVASPDLIQLTRGLPETRSGKTMRRILRKVAEDDWEQLGDTSTLLDPSVVDSLIENRLNRSDGE